MANYRVIFADLVPPVGSSGIREEIPVNDLKWSKILNSAGAMSGWVDLDHPKCTRANIDPGGTAVYIERGGLLVWGGILWTAKVDTVTRKLELGAEGFWSYFKHREIKNRVAMKNVTAGALNTHRPKADVSKAGGTGVPDNTNFWNDLDNAALNTAVNVQSSTSFAAMNYQGNFDITAGTYAGLLPGSVRVVMTCSSVFGFNIIPSVKIGGTQYFGQWQPMTPASSIKTVSNTWSVNPATGLAWTPSEVEAFASGSSAGFDTDFCLFPGDMLVYQLWIEISWGTSGTAVFQNIDELAITRDVINNAQAQPGGNLGIVVGNELTTDLDKSLFKGITVTYHQYERKNVNDAITALSTAVGGFDFDITTAWDTAGTTPVNTLHLYYPRKGRRIDGLVFNHNVVGFSAITNSVDATAMANSVTVFGSGDSDNMMIASAADTSLLNRYPLLESSVSYKDIADQTALQSIGRAEIIRHKTPIETPSISKDADKWPDVGAFQVGDEGLVVISDAWVQFNSYQRIQSFEVAVGNEGQETMTPVFVSADLFA